MQLAPRAREASEAPTADAMLGPHFRQPGPAVPPELQVRKAAEAPTAAAVLAPNPQRARAASAAQLAWS